MWGTVDTLQMKQALMVKNQRVLINEPLCNSIIFDVINFRVSESAAVGNYTRNS